MVAFLLAGRSFNFLRKALRSAAPPSTRAYSRLRKKSPRKKERRPCVFYFKVVFLCFLFVFVESLLRILLLKLPQLLLFILKQLLVLIEQFQSVFHER